MGEGCQDEGARGRVNAESYLLVQLTDDDDDDDDDIDTRLPLIFLLR